MVLISILILFGLPVVSSVITTKQFSNLSDDPFELGVLAYLTAMTLGLASQLLIAMLVNHYSFYFLTAVVLINLLISLVAIKIANFYLSILN